MNTVLREKAKNGFKKDFFYLHKQCIFGKTMKKSVRKTQIYQACKNRAKGNYLLSEPNCRILNNAIQIRNVI